MRETTGTEGGEGELGPRRVLPPAPQPHSPSGPSLAQLGAGSALLPPLACWASRRAQAPLATTHCYAPRALSRQRRYRLPRAARAPSGHTEGLEEAVSAGGRPARGISEIGEASTRLAHAQSL